ncbi:fumarylacetoacetate hydrolase family protein [Saccharopolyspora rhizosphaerae]|uniref:fumarylacetoacetate hydrolase family protein n=1 Tax=Saccharopolyspora rhizosphaerae TaxID=2492662 RepID=UPI0026C22AC7|nr:fumarylacetoacetate hydrolase family protein [Saccharopolyspora rhizosphaerae]
MLDAADLVRDVSGFAHDIDGDLLADPERLAAVEAGREALPVLSAARFGPPISRPGKVVGIGLNYRCHAAAAGVEPPTEPIVFLKPSSGITGPDDEIVLPPGSTGTDWEVELGVVVGTRLRHCSDPARALRAVAGYVAANDVTERRHLTSGPTWARGKCHDTFSPIGPWLVTADEIPDPQALDLGLRVNGTPRQQGSTAQMVFGVAELLAHLSGLMTLDPGDLVLTGTPAGVAALHPEPRPYLRPRDVVEVEVEHLGRHRSTVRG